MLNWSEPNKGTLAVLSGYNAQVACLRSALKQFNTYPEYDSIKVLNVHRSQAASGILCF